MYNDLNFMLFDALRRAGRSMRARKPRCDEDGRGGPAVKREIILAILSDNGGVMRHNQLASAFRVSPSTLSEMLNRLEEDGLLERVSDPADRRATLLKLTGEGNIRADEIKDEARRELAATFENLDDDEKRQLIYLLNKIPDPDKAE